MDDTTNRRDTSWHAGEMHRLRQTARLNHKPDTLRWVWRCLYATRRAMRGAK